MVMGRMLQSSRWWFCLVFATAALSLAPASADEKTSVSSYHVLDKGGMFDLFLEGVGESELKAKLNGPGSFTLFVPRDQAFDELDQETLEALRLPANKELLAKLIRYHVVEEPITSQREDLPKGTELTCLNGETIKLKKSGSRLTVNGNIRIIKADIRTGNGVIHIIDKVLVPQEFKIALQPAKPKKPAKRRS